VSGDVQASERHRALSRVVLNPDRASGSSLQSKKRIARANRAGDSPAPSLGAGVSEFVNQPAARVACRFDVSTYSPIWRNLS
jgi:hypothetical protein